jgi:hypothetical protein
VTVRRTGRGVRRRRGRPRADRRLTLEGLTVTGGAPGYMLIPPTCHDDGRCDRDRGCTLESVQLGGDGHVIEDRDRRRQRLGLDEITSAPPARFALGVRLD